MPSPVLLALLLAGQGPGSSTCAPDPSEAAREEARLERERGQGLLDARRFGEAEQAFLAAARLDEASPFSHYALGLALSGQGRHGEAALAFARCREALRCLRQDPQAKERFRERLDREVQQLRGALAEIERSRLKRAAIPYQEVNGSAPPSLGGSTQAVHELERRLSDLQKLRQNPDQEPAAVGIALGNAWFLAGELARAEEAFRAALATEPDNPDARHNLGMALLFAGSLDEAERHLKAAEKAGVKTDRRLQEELKRRRAAAHP